jgi:hypothetical protein
MGGGTGEREGWAWRGSAGGAAEGEGGGRLAWVMCRFELYLLLGFLSFVRFLAVFLFLPFLSYILQACTRIYMYICPVLHKCPLDLRETPSRLGLHNNALGLREFTSRLGLHNNALCLGDSPGHDLVCITMPFVCVTLLVTTWFA